MAEVAIQKSETDSFWGQMQRMEDRVMRRAYDIFRDTGCQDGKDLENWLAAERELIQKPAIQVKEAAGRFEIQVAVAGMEAKDLKVEVTGDDLVVTGENKTEKKEEKGEIHTSEFQSGTLFRSVHLPKKIDPDKTKADIKNGLLTITAPIAEESQVRKIKVQAA